MPLVTRARPPLRVALAALLLVGLHSFMRGAHDDASRTRPLTIISTGTSDPIFVAYRGEQSTWSVLSRTTEGYVVPAPAPRFTVVAVCPAIDDAEEVHVFHLANRDAHLLPIQCRANAYPRTRTPVSFVDPAREAVAGDQHAAVQTDGHGNIVNRDDEVYLLGDRADWIATSRTPHRVLLTHDVPVAGAHRTITVTGGAAPDHMTITIEGIAPDHHASPLVEFRSRNGTRFVGLGEHRPGVWHIVPRAQRLAGDYDIIHSTLIIDDDALAALAAGVEAPTSVTVALPTARPTSSVDGNRLTWRNAANPDLISIDYTTARSTWTVHASRAWLGSRTSYAPVDATQIPTWRWSPSPSIPTWVTWQWTSDRRSLPFDWFTPPPGVIYWRVADKPR